MIITDTTQNPVVNTSINLKDIAALSNGRTDCAQILATGALTSGEIKLTFSQDNVNFYPLADADGFPITLTPQIPVYLKFANLYIKCDLSSAQAQELKVQVQ